MNNSFLIVILSTLAILTATFIINTIVTKKMSSKKGLSNDDWDVGGRSLPLYVIVGTQFATAMGGGILVGQVGNGYNNGWSVLLYGILGQLPYFILMFIAKWLREKEFTTIPEILQEFSGKSKAVSVISAILAAVVPLGWICSNLNAFGKLYTQISGIPFNVLVIALCLISLFFVMPAGLKTVAWTDFIFSCLMIIFAGITVFFVVNHMAGGIENVFSNVPDEISTFPQSMFSVGIYTVLLWIFSLVPGGLTNQMYYQRIFALKEGNKVNLSLLLTTLASIFAYIWAIYMGLGIRSVNSELSDGEMATGWLFTKMPVWLLALFSGLIIATIMSTISSAVQSIVVNLNRDIYKLYNPNVSDEKSLKISKLLSAAVLFVACCISLFFPAVMKMLVATYSFSAAGLLCPIFVSYALRKRNIVNKYGIISGMAAGVFFCALSMTMNTKIPYAIYGILPSAAALIFVSIATKNRSKSIRA